MDGCFVTGTDTGVGKTVVAATIVATLRARGLSAQARKPLITGLDEPARPDWPHDHELLARAACCAPDEVAFRCFGPPVSPHLALEMSGERLEIEQMLGWLRRARDDADALVVEGVGGLLVPLGDGYDVRGLAVDLGLPLVIAARPGLGTLNHTLLTIEAARRASLDIAAVVLTPWPQAPSDLERSNRETLERLGEVPLATLPLIASPEPEALEAAGRLLPVEQWVLR